MVLINLIQLMTGSISILEFLQNIVYSLIAVVVALSVHECCHALVSYWCGDKTAKYQGRISLNPFHHINWIGMIFLLLFGFGWANPVMINPRNYKKPRLYTIFTALAGPVSNLLTGFVFSLIYVFIYLKLDIVTNAVFWSNFANLFVYIILINITFAIFNLIPLPPLDGSKVLGELLPLKYRYKYYSIERYSMFILIGLILVLRQFNFLAIIQSSIFSLFIKGSAAIFGIHF